MRVWVGLGIGALLLAWGWLAGIGPRSVSPAATDAAGTPSVGALREQAAQALAAWQASGESDAEALRTAVAAQEALVARAAGGGQAESRRLLELQERLADVHAQALEERIRALEAGADAAERMERWPEVETAVREALAWQQEVNRSVAPAGRKNFRRESALEQRLQELEARPLAEEVAAAREIARREASAERWPEALAAWRAARAGQQRLNAEYARSRYADPLALRAMEEEIESLDSAAVAREVAAFETEGDEALAAGDAVAAAAAYARARQVQGQLNDLFARSRFRSSSRMEVLEVKRQTAESVPLVAAWRTEEAAIAALLQAGRTEEAAERIGPLADQVRAGYERLAKSERLDAALRLKLTYLAGVKDRLGEIQGAVAERLRPIPGAREWRMLATEFPQALYAQVMKENPSRNEGRAYPVDSVNWAEAAACAERLSWVLGRPVRLPTADEFRAAVGDAGAGAVHVAEGAGGGGAESVGRGVARSRAMADGPANTDGFFDLLGNVAEWLNAEPDAGMDTAPVAGGCFLDTEAEVRAVPVRWLPRGTRAGHVGFRVVVEAGGGLEVPSGN